MLSREDMGVCGGRMRMLRKQGSQQVSGDGYPCVFREGDDVSSSTSFHTEHEPWCQVTSRLVEAKESAGGEAFAYVSIDVPNGDLGIFFRDPAVLDTLAGKCKEAAEFLRGQSGVKAEVKP